MVACTVDNSAVMLKTIEHYPGLLSTMTSPFLAAL